MSWTPVLTLAARLVVEAGSPDALCPDLASTEAAIGARLGELAADGAADWRVRYTMGHAPQSSSGDFIRLELFDPKSELRLTRDLPLAGESCATMARVIALVVDRFFRDLVAEPHAPDPAEHPAESEVSSPAAASATADVASPEREAPESGPRPASSLTAEGGFVTAPFRPSIGLSFIHEASSGISLAASVTWIVSPATEELERGGRAEHRSALLRLVPAWDVAFGSARIGLGPSVALIGQWGSTVDLPETDQRYRTALAAGAVGRARLALGANSAIQLSGGIEVPFLPFGGEFVIDGEEVLEPPAAQAFVAVGFGPAWFR